jgi:hypothetical protein
MAAFVRTLTARELWAMLDTPARGRNRIARQLGLGFIDLDGEGPPPLWEGELTTLSDEDVLAPHEAAEDDPTGVRR